MNSFGRKFKVSIFGESHGEATGIVIDGVKPGITLSEQDFTADIQRRKSGAKGTTPRIEADEPKILSGVFEGHTTGAPLTVVFQNTNTHSADYELFRAVPRPGHADYTAGVKWDNQNDPRGGGHFSGRLTLPVVAAGVVAKKMLDCDFKAEIIEIGGVCRQAALKGKECGLTDAQIWNDVLNEAIREQDSVGGIVECRISGLKAGLGEPFFDSVESLISHAIFAIPGVRGIEFGDGFASARMKGSEHNDSICVEDNELPKTSKNGAGGINGGISNGNSVVFRVAFKPTSSIGKTQHSYNFKTRQMDSLEIPGRHDACIVLRTPVIVEAMAAVVLADLTSIF